MQQITIKYVKVLCYILYPQIEAYMWPKHNPCSQMMILLKEMNKIEI